MPHAFAEIAFTPAVQAAQQRDGSRAGYARSFESSPERHHDRFGDDEREFIAAQRSLYLATVSETGWPYVQHRGGPPGFVKVLDERRLAFADFAGNRQLVSVGNLAGNDRASMILVDYARRVRLKLLGHLAVQPLDGDATLAAALALPGYKARPQRAFVFTLAAFDWNCPQHIPQRFDAEDVQRTLAEREQRIAALQAELEAMRARAA